jgi:hypothetical protein
MKWVFAIAASVSLGMAQAPPIESIMSRVAVNQAKSLDQRQQYVYTQKQLLRFVRGNGKVAREERRDYTVTPAHRGIQKTLIKFDGKYERNGAYITYDHPGYEYKNVDIDGNLMDEMSKEMLSNHKGRDGIDPELFPLTNHQQLKYNFRLIGTETYRNRQVYRVAFEPKPHQEDAPWKGEALIDTAEFQPVLVTTKLAHGLPLVVKTLLGTNIKGLGFSVSYAKFEDGVWFPVSYGGEFDVRAAFFYKRTMAVSATNTDFRRTDVTSEIAYETDKQ